METIGDIANKRYLVIAKPSMINDINESMINESSLKENINESMINDKLFSKDKTLQTERIADDIIRRFANRGINAEHSRNFFLKCAWNLPESVLYDKIEIAMKPGIKNSLKYAITCLHKAMN